MARKGAPNALATSSHCRTHLCGGKPCRPVILRNRNQAADRNVDLGTDHIPDRALTIPPLATIERQHLVLDEFSDAPQCLGRPLGVLPDCALAHRGLQFAPGSHVRRRVPRHAAAQFIPDATPPVPIQAAPIVAARCVLPPIDGGIGHLSAPLAGFPQPQPQREGNVAIPKLAWRTSGQIRSHAHARLLGSSMPCPTRPRRLERSHMSVGENMVVGQVLKSRRPAHACSGIMVVR